MYMYSSKREDNSRVSGKSASRCRLSVRKGWSRARAEGGMETGHIYMTSALMGEVVGQNMTAVLIVGCVNGVLKFEKYMDVI